jgi:4-hydroxybenzoate decarboxylase
MRSYIDTLRERGELRIVRREVDPEFELAAVVARSQRDSDAPVLFERVKGSSFPVISNIYGSHRRLCELIGATPGTFCARWTELTGDASSDDRKYLRPASDTGDLVNGRISDLPLVRYFERDAAPYITAGVFLAKEPDTGIPNLSFCRSMMIDDSELRVRIAPPHDLAKYQRKAESRDEPLEVAILLGPPPEVFMAACASVPYDADELSIAGRISAGGIDLRSCESIDLMVPAETEIVIEGRILPHTRKPEAPFGEFLGYYVEEMQSHVFEITNVSWRRGAIFHALLCGYPEDLRSLEIAFASRTYRHLVKDLPGILDVSCHPNPLQTVVRIDKQYEGHAEHVMLKAFSSHLGYNKICIVVDEDVDIHDFEDVWWAVVTRCRVDQKLMTLHDIPGFFRDEARVHWGRLGIDATRPVGREKEFERKRIGWTREIDPRDYFEY